MVFQWVQCANRALRFSTGMEVGVFIAGSMTIKQFNDIYQPEALIDSFAQSQK